MDVKGKHDDSRRKFLIQACSAGVGMAAGAVTWESAAAQSSAADTPDPSGMPRRPFGKTGVQVPILGLGGSLNLMNQQLLLGQALKMGVRYWDTADNYSGGRSESGIGSYFAKYPEDRKQVFLVTKTGSGVPERMTAGLQESLRRLETDYVDLFLIHALAGLDGELTADTRHWVDQAKADGRIRFFGFSTHRNMAACLAQAARLDWIDGIMLTYNYRLMDDDDLQQAMDACAQAGIGLIAMKTQGQIFSFADSARGDELVQGFEAQGRTPHQARLKAVWQNPKIAGICSHMDSLAVLKANVAAAVDRQALSERDRSLLKRHARQTAAAYCTGCGDICESLLDHPVPVADVMRCLMYAHGYNDYQMAREAYARLSAETRRRLTQTDFAAAENRCPQRMPIGALMRRAAEALG